MQVNEQFFRVFLSELVMNKFTIGEMYSVMAKVGDNLVRNHSKTYPTVVESLVNEIVDVMKEE